MIKAMGVDVSEAARVDGGVALLEAECKCRFCANEQNCQEWLNSDSHSRPFPDFCSNSEFFSAHGYPSQHSAPAPKEFDLRRCPVCRLPMRWEPVLSSDQQLCRYCCAACGTVVEEK